MENGHLTSGNTNTSGTNRAGRLEHHEQVQEQGNGLGEEGHGRRQQGHYGEIDAQRSEPGQKDPSVLKRLP